MANIEIHGLKNTEALSMRSHIDDIVRQRHISDDCITTIIPSTAKSCGQDNASKPFLRIYAETPLELEVVIKGLRDSHIALDYEGVVLKVFYSAGNNKQIPSGGY